MSPAENGLHSLIMIKTNLFFSVEEMLNVTLGLPDLPSSLMGELWVYLICLRH